MKPVLTFVEYTEEHDEFKVEVGLKAVFNNKTVTCTYPAISQRIATDGVLDGIFRKLIDDAATEALIQHTVESPDFLNHHEMSLSDKLSIFDIRQTVEFNNSLHQHFRATDVILAAIW